MTTDQIRIRLTTDDIKELKKVAGSYDLNVTALCGVFVKAALRAVKENKNRLALPLRFRIEEQEKRE